jgi:hypothetical protein
MSSRSGFSSLAEARARLVRLAMSLWVRVSDAVVVVGRKIAAAVGLGDRCCVAGWWLPADVGGAPQAFDHEPAGEIVCNQGRGTTTMGIFPGHLSLVNWEAVIPADSGSSKTLRAEDVGRKEALTITVLEVPSGQ